MMSKQLAQMILVGLSSAVYTSIMWGSFMWKMKTPLPIIAIAITVCFIIFSVLALCYFAKNGQ